MHKIQFVQKQLEKHHFHCLVLSVLCHVTLSLHFCIHREVKPSYKELVLVVLSSTGIVTHPIEKQRVFPSTACSEPHISLYSQGGPLPHRRALLCGLSFLQGHYLPENRPATGRCNRLYSVMYFF